MEKNYFSLLILLLLFSNEVFSQNFKGIIENHFNENFQELNLLEEDISEWVITNEVYSKKSKVTHVYVQQSYKGIPIFGAVGNFAIKENKIIYSQNSFIANISEKSNSINPILTPTNAIERSALELNLGAVDKITLLENIGLNQFLYSTSGISQEKIPVKLVYQPIHENSRLMLAWNLSIFQLDGKHWWNIRMDAKTGEILNKNDYTVNCNINKRVNTSSFNRERINNESFLEKEQSIVFSGEQYNVFAIPTQSPNDGSRSIVTEPQNTEASPFGWHDTDGVDGAEYTYTRGNNVYAQEDIDANNITFGNAPDGTASLNFDFPLDFNQQPSGYQDASLTNLFYLNNIMHDIWYHYGFDQEAGSFQTNNYGAQGFGEDPVIADGQDGEGTNNANFSTPPDGSSPRMQMFLWNPPPADLLTINSGNLAGSYLGIDSNYGGPALPTTPITSDLVLADDGFTPTDDACTSLINGTDVNGKIAVIVRGDCNFTVKVQFAQDAGAIAVLMVNNVDGPPITMGGTSTTITIPAIMISKADGDPIIEELNNGETINATLVAPTESFQIDASLDNVIIAHEYGHGISNRIVGGPSNTSCIFNSESLGEGWSDFFGLMITMKSSDTEDIARGVATYSNGESSDGQGIREYKYSPDMSINPFTLEDVEDQWFNDSNNIPTVSPHGVGSIWATMLWDLNWKMISAYGFDPDFYNGTGGNNMTMHLVMEGLKLTPCSSGFEAARDAILAADDALYSGANKCLIWQVFSRRGLGYSASSGSTNSYNDQTAAYDMPPESELGGASCSLSVKKEALDIFNIYPNPSNGEIKINGIGINEDVNISIFDMNGRKVYEKELSLNGDTIIKTTRLNTGFYILKIKGDKFTHNEKIIIE